MISRSIVTLIIVAVLLSCESNLNEVNKFGIEVDTPQGVTTMVDLKYTDSGKVKAHLKTPLLLDYSQEDYPYRIFPKSVKVDFYENITNKNIIMADSAVEYSKANLIDLRHNVKIITADSVILTTSQLYWDTKKQWVFTDRNYTIKLANGTENSGIGFDANQDFTVFNSRVNTGIQILEE